MGHWLVRIAGAVAIVGASFLLTLYVLDSRNTPATRDARRVDDIRKVREAIRNFYEARKTYPADLKVLVDGGYLNSIPADPLWPGSEQRYQYYSNGINNFGLLVWLEQPQGNVPAGTSCRSGVGTKEAAMWGNIPECPF
jgi:hypothetical protein